MYVLGRPGSSFQFTFRFQFDIHLWDYISAILFHNLSSSFTQLEYSTLLQPLRFFGEKLCNMIFHVDKIP